ncbi:MAG: methyltransferase, partial [Patescibacteria group bacterium]
ETEDLVEEALKIPATHYADIGTGSGAIGVTLAAESPRSTVFASDANAKTLAVAKKNARRLAPGHVRFFHGSLLHPTLIRSIRAVGARHAVPLRLTIVANLPYLPPSDKKIMPASVTKYEPYKALFTDDDGMKLNKRLLVQISHLQPTAYHLPTIALLEFDPPQSKKLSAFAKSLFPDADVSIIRDRCGRERILRVNLRSRRKSRLAS